MQDSFLGYNVDTSMNMNRAKTNIQATRQHVTSPFALTTDDYSTFLSDEENSVHSKVGERGHTLSIFSWELLKLVHYFLGGLAFLFGSIFFHPRMDSLSRNIPWITIGASLFIFGCVLFLFGTLQDLFEQKRKSSHHYFKSHHENTKLFMSTLNVFASISFIYGAIYFLPKFYAMNDHIGDYSFIFGCTILCITSYHHIHNSSNSNERCIVDAHSSICTIIGSFLFILGCIGYMPENANSDQDVAIAVDLFIIGSVFFTVGPMIDINVWIKEHRKH